MEQNLIPPQAGQHRGNRATALVLVACLILTLCLAFAELGCRDTYSGDSPWAWPTDSLATTNERWSLALATLLTSLDNTYRSYDDYDTLVATRFEYVRTHGMWFCAIMSRRNDSIGFYSLLVGWLRGYQVGQRDVGDWRNKLEESLMSKYVRLVASDSLWSLFGEFGFWDDDDWWETKYDASGAGQLETMRYTFLLDIKNWRARTPEWVPYSVGQGFASEDSLTEVSWLQVSFWLLRDLPGWVWRDAAYAALTPRQDLFVHRGRHFVGVFSRRNTQVGAYMAVVGQHLGDSIVYREMGQEVPLRGDGLQDYLRLARADSLWTLLGARELFDDEAGLEQLWMQTEQRQRPDSSAVPARVLRFSAQPP